MCQFPKKSHKNGKTQLDADVDEPSFPWYLPFWPSAPQERPEILVHATCSQLLQAVVAMDDIVGGHHDHPDSVGVLAELAADGRAHDHVQAGVAAAGISVIMAGEDRFHPCGGGRGGNLGHQ